MRWKPSPFIAASCAAHAAAAVGALAWPQHWPWFAGAVLGNQALLTGAGLLPRSDWLGPNITRLPAAAAARGEVALTFDDGPDPEVTPRVLDLLARHGARASFFCVGERVQRHRDLARAIAAAGHTIENHTQTHPNHFAALGPAGMRAQIRAAQASIADAVGRAPRFFRAVAGLRNPMLDPVLHAEGLRLAHWTRRGYDTREARADVVLRRLTRGLAAGDILLLHDGHCARDANGTPVVLAVLPRLLEIMNEKGMRPSSLDNSVMQADTPKMLSMEAA
jgi:peptidoglycan/xylan/chitin deacetylase (PgdA/CDA1 family)